MKKLLAPLVLLMALMVGSLGHAQSEGFGIYSGYPEWIGVQTQTGGLRLGAGLSFLGIGGSADLVLGKQSLGTTNLDLSWYYGAGVSAGVWLFLAGQVYVFPHGLVGLEWDPTAMGLTGMKFYTEFQVGAGISLPGGIYPDFNSRVGLIFK